MTDDYCFKCLTCGHDMFYHFHATGPCNDLVGDSVCECVEFVSQLMKDKPL